VREVPPGTSIYLAATPSRVGSEDPRRRLTRLEFIVRRAKLSPQTASAATSPTESMTSCSLIELSQLTYQVASAHGIMDLPG